MPARLAVLAPTIGLPSETFVARHTCALAPGATLAVTRAVADEPAWLPDGAPVVLAEDAGAFVRPPRGRLAYRAWHASGRWRPAPGWRPTAASRDALRHAVAGVPVAMTEYLDVWLPVLADLQDAGVATWGHAHGYDVSRRLRSRTWAHAYRDAWRTAAGIIAVSDHSRRALIDIGLDPATIHVVPCGTDVPDEAPSHEWGDEVRIVAVGRFVAKKAPLTTIRAFAHVAAERPELRLEMIGDGPLLDDAAALLGREGLTDRVTLHGARPPTFVVDALRRAHVFVQHSVVDPDTGDEEGLPVAVLEAMAAALPVVATRHAGIPEAVAAGETGLLVEENDVNGMAAALAQLVADPARARALGEAGWDRARTHFSWPRERTDLRSLLGLGDAAD